ncbi:radical SAM protein [Methanocaldococcus villosus KIN24-T80]|uniref:Radical SAM protein n=1 Tax=Methanocaldococcus villosus KIN24-T80 TaxID=1069083 RepID=N6V221_9EURY|nr:AmmeMemoRadiSam system radical SAM enzyme [Methanocaldococcus villosus]ENN96333.1 radical SAM protein [Methanocaldococcus villosus KIN24-T80]
MKEAMFYKNINGDVICLLCPRHCVIKEGKRGFCYNRENINGKLYAVGYGKVCSLAIDPIEKKPLYHFYPGSKVLSLAIGGCNFRCLHCQNWTISQVPPDKTVYREMSPEDVIEIALEYNLPGLSYTYTEPTVFYEFMYDCSILAKKYGLFNTMVTNGYIEKEPLKALPIDAMNIDIKGNERFYKEVCKAELEPVLKTCVLAKKLNIWVEITNLIIPGYNDSEDDILFIIEFVRDKLGRETPLHFSRFHPDYKLTNVPPTPIETLIKARELALEEGLKYVYIGNVPGLGENTYCPNCGALLIERSLFSVRFVNLEGDRCSVCGEKIDIITR